MRCLTLCIFPHYISLIFLCRICAVKGGIKKGEPLLSWGLPFGYALRDIEPGIIFILLLFYFKIIISTNTICATILLY